MENNKIRVLNPEFLIEEIEKMKVRIEDLEKNLAYKLPEIDTETKEKVLTHLSLIDAILDEESPSINEIRNQLQKAKQLLNRIP